MVAPVHDLDAVSAPWTGASLYLQLVPCRLVRSILVSMSSEQVWGATASLQGSIQSRDEQVAEQRTRAIEAEAKLTAISSITSYVFASQALAINTPLVKFAAAVSKIISGEVF